MIQLRKYNCNIQECQLKLERRYIRTYTLFQISTLLLKLDQKWPKALLIRSLKKDMLDYV